jgi:hypothetical protein
MLLLHLVSRAEETMTLSVSSFKHFHGPLPAGPHQWPAQAETGKVSDIERYAGVLLRDLGEAVEIPQFNLPFAHRIARNPSLFGQHALAQLLA